MGIGWPNWLYVASANLCFITSNGLLVLRWRHAENQINSLLDLIFLLDKKCLSKNGLKKEKLFHLNGKLQIELIVINTHIIFLDTKYKNGSCLWLSTDVQIYRLVVSARRSRCLSFPIVCCRHCNVW